MSVSLVALLALGHCAAFVDRNLPAIAAPLLKADFGLDDSQLGLLMGPAFAVLYAAGMLLTMPLAGSRHRFRLLAGCIATWAIGMIAFALAQSFGELFAARALVGLGQAAFVPLALGLIIEGAPPERRARSVAVFTAGSAIGRSLSLVLGGLALAMLVYWLPSSAMAHWRALFIAMAAPNLVLILILLRCRERPPLSTGRTTTWAEIWAWSRRRPALLALYLCCAGGSVLVVQTVGAWAPSILHREQGMMPADAALAFGSALLVASPLGHLIAGTLVDTRGRRITPMGVVAGGVVAAIPLLWGASQVTSELAACLLLAMTSLAAGAAAVAALAGLPLMLPRPLRGPAVRLFLVFITITGVGLGPFVAGVVSDGLGEGGRGLSTALYLVCGSAAALAVASAMLARRGWRQATSEVST